MEVAIEKQERKRQATGVIDGQSAVGIHGMCIRRTLVWSGHRKLCLLFVDDDGI